MRDISHKTPSSSSYIVPLPDGEAVVFFFAAVAVLQDDSSGCRLLSLMRQTESPIYTERELWAAIGPNDRLAVHLFCSWTTQTSDASCKVIGVG